jgi:hypothetical protein
MAARQQLHDEAVRILQEMHDADREQYTALARDLADTMVSLREHYPAADGRPDWSGHSWDYRSELRKIYSDAGYTDDERVGMQTIVRYHIGVQIRRRLSPAELQEAGIGATSRPSLADTVVALRSALAALTCETVTERKYADPGSGEAVDAIVLLLEAIRERSGELVEEIAAVRP